MVNALLGPALCVERGFRQQLVALGLRIPMKPSIVIIISPP
jgi:hypothetical protein